MDTVQSISTQVAVRETDVSAPFFAPDQRHHEQDKPFDHSETKHTPDNPVQEQDMTALATLSVIRFLENILEKKLGLHGDPTSPKWFSNVAVNQNQAKKAAYAYAHAAEISKVKLSQLPRTRMHKKTGAVNTEEIYALIRTLREIYASGILTLNVKQDLPFFESIKSAVANIKSA